MISPVYCENCKPIPRLMDVVTEDGKSHYECKNCGETAKMFVPPTPEFYQDDLDHDQS